MKACIAVLPGDGIGPEVVRQAIRVLKSIEDVYDHEFVLTEGLIGGCALDQTGEPLPETTVSLCHKADAVLLGAIGGPKWDQSPIRPEKGLLGLRKCLNVYANIRPVSIHPALVDASPLKREILQGVDLIVVRELTGGIYFGEKHRSEFEAYDVCSYTVGEIERVTRVACRLAMNRSKKLVSVDKANVLETSRLWRHTVTKIIENEFPELQLDHILVDAAAMHLIRRPADFDVILTENMFGDILTDEASMLAGSMGLLPSASFGDQSKGLYEPIHGSAPDIAGKGIANPYAAILCVAMMLRHSFDLEEEARNVESTVHDCLQDGLWTPDLDKSSSLKTEDIGNAVIKRLSSRLVKK